MKAIWFKEFRLYTSFDRALWCALIWPFILALNPLFLEAGESLSTAMIDAPGFALLFSLCVDYTTYDDYRSGVFELIVQAGLPLTRSVLRSVVADATPGQLGVLADLFRAENASRTQSRRARLIRNAGFPCVKGFDGYDWGMASFPADWGREQLMDLGFVDRAEDLVLYGDVGCGKTHMAIAVGMLACERGMPVRFFTASSLVMRLRRARDENRLDAELRAIGRARLLVIDELGYLPIDIDGARLLFQVVADSYEKRSVVFTTNLEFGRWGEVFGDGDMAAAVIDRIVHHGRIVRFRGESYRNSHSLMR